MWGSETGRGEVREWWEIRKERAMEGGGEDGGLGKEGIMEVRLG